MSTRHYLLVFSLDGQRYALNLASVDRVIHAVEMISLPKVSGIILGLINLQGQVFPVLDLRKQLGLPEREVQLTDHLIIAHTSRWKVALVVNTVHAVIEQSEQEVLAAKKIFRGIENISGIVKLEENIILIHDLEKAISIDEEQTLAKALREKSED